MTAPTATRGGPATLLGETSALFELALPMSVLQFAVYFIFPETASVVGLQLGKEYLAGFSLGSLTGNLTLLTITVGVVSAADTLMPRAFATGQYSELGKLAIRTFVEAMIVMLVPCILLVSSMEPIYRVFHQNATVAHIATQWLKVFVIGAPFALLVRICQRFLGSQRVVWPIGISTSVGAFLIHPVLLWILVPRMGFVGSAVAIVITQFMQIFLALVYLNYFPVHHPDSWGKLTWESFCEACQLRPMLAYAKLSIGGVLSFTEWCFWVSATDWFGNVRSFNMLPPVLCEMQPLLKASLFVRAFERCVWASLRKP